MSKFLLLVLLVLATPVFGQKLLDPGELTATSTAAYSVRQLKTTYSHSAITPPAAVSGFTNSSTPLIRVRRSSDNGQLDIGYLSSGELDTVTLKSFVGPGNGFVSVWYDQSGNSRDVSQATASRQPRIVNGGTIERATTGRIAMRFVRDGGNTYAGSNNLSRTMPPSDLFTGGITGSAISVFEASGGNASAWGYGEGNNRWQIHANEGGGLKFDYGNSYQRTAYTNTANEGLLRTYLFTAQTAQPGKIYVDGILMATGQIPANACTATLFQIGGIESFMNWNHDNRQAELILFNSVLNNNDRVKGFEDQQSFYINQYNWTGATSSDFNTASNWNKNAVPGTTDEILISPNKPNALILTANQTVAKLTVFSGATLTINSGVNLNVTEIVNNGGSITGSGTLVLNGTATQDITGTDGVFGNVTINNSNNVRMPISGTFNGLVTLTNGSLQLDNNTTNPVTINTVTFNGGITNMNASRCLRSSDQTDIVLGGSSTYNLFFDQTSAGTTNRIRNFTVNTSGTITISNPVAIVGGDVTIGANAIVDLGTATVNRSAAGGTLTVEGELRLGANTGGAGASNFPNNFSTLTLPGTVVYNLAGNQTVVAGTYGNLTLVHVFLLVVLKKTASYFQETTDCHL